MQKYEWKSLYEAGRAGVFAVIVFVLTAVVGLQGGGVEDWEAWGLSLASGAAAAGAAAMLAFLTRNKEA